MTWGELRDLVFPDTVRAALGLWPGPPGPDTDGDTENDAASPTRGRKRANPRFS